MCVRHPGLRAWGARPRGHCERRAALVRATRLLLLLLRNFPLVLVSLLAFVAATVAALGVVARGYEGTASGMTHRMCSSHCAPALFRYPSSCWWRAFTIIIIARPSWGLARCGEIDQKSVRARERFFRTRVIAVGRIGCSRGRVEKREQDDEAEREN